MHSAAFLPTQEPRREAREIAPSPEQYIGSLIGNFVGALAAGILEHQQLAGICEHSARLAPILDTGHIFSRVS